MRHPAERLIPSEDGDASLRRLLATVTVCHMQATSKSDAASMKGDGGIRLRLEVYDALAAAKRVTTVVAQAAMHGIGRQHMSDIRSGKRRPSLGLAMRMAADLGTTVEALFERRPS